MPAVQANLIIQALGKTFVDRQVLLRQAPDADAYQNEVVEVLGTFPGITKSKDSLTLNRIAWGGHVLADVQLKETKKNSRVFRSADGAVTLSDVRLLSEDLAEVPTYADKMFATLDVPAWKMGLQPLKLQRGFTNPDIFENSPDPDQTIYNAGGGKHWFPDADTVNSQLEWKKFFVEVYNPGAASPFQQDVSVQLPDGSVGQTVRSTMKPVADKPGYFRSDKPLLLIDGTPGTEASQFLEGTFLVIPNLGGQIFAGFGDLRAIVFPQVMCLLGDGFAAGFQHGTWLKDYQPNGYGTLVARAFGLPFALPEIENGIPVPYFRLAQRTLIITVPKEAVPDGKWKPKKTPADLHNFAIPRLTIREFRQAEPNGRDESYPFADTVRKGLGREFTQAVADRKPSLVVMAFGMEEAIRAAIGGDVLDDKGNIVKDKNGNEVLISAADFSAQLESTIDIYHNPLKGPKADVVLVNIPDVSKFPGFIPLRLPPAPGAKEGKLNEITPESVPFDKILVDGEGDEADKLREFLKLVFNGVDGKRVRLSDTDELDSKKVHPAGTKVPLGNVRDKVRVITNRVLRTANEVKEVEEKVEIDLGPDHPLQFISSEVLTPAELKVVSDRIGEYNKAIKVVFDYRLSSSSRAGRPMIAA